jgi:hypothetical protein
MQSRKKLRSAPPADAALTPTLAPAPPPVAFEPLEGRTLMSAVLLSDAGVLTLTGDEARANMIRVDSANNNITAIANGVYRTFPLWQVTSIEVTGGSLGDRVRIARTIKLPTTISVAGGNDIVVGGSGPDAIYGGSGNDVITGRAGKDKLIGNGGYDTLMGTRGVDLMFQGDDTPQDPDPPPPPPPIPEGPPPVLVRDFGAKGDGVTNDIVAIQAAVDAAPAGATVMFAPGTYRITECIMVRKSLTFVGNGATLLFDNAGRARTPWVDKQFYIVSNLIADQNGQVTERYSWQETVKAGQNTFAVSIPQDRLHPGDMVYLELGQDPHDPFTQHLNTLATVVQNTGSSVMLDFPVPYDIHQGTWNHRITQVASLTRDVTIRGFNMAQTPGSIADMNISVEHCTNIRIEDITGTFTNAINIADSKDVSIEGVRGTLDAVHSRAGRVLTAWQSERLTMKDVNVSSRFDAPVVFLESWQRGTTISDMEINLTFTNRGVSDVLHFSGGSYNTTVDNLIVHNIGAIQLVNWGAPSQRGQFHLGRVEVTGPVSLLQADAIDTLVTPTRTYSQVKTVQKVISLAPNSDNMTTILESGLIRRLNVTISTTTGVQSVLLVDPQDRGANLTSLLRPGRDVNIPDISVSGDQFWINTLDGPAKRLFVYTSADLPAGAKIVLTMEYFE